MGITEQLTEAMKTSMKAGDAERTSVVRLLRGALKNEEIKVGHVLEEAEALKVLQREAKQRRDSIEAYRSAGRDDLADKEEAELVVIAGYLPEAMSDEELAKVVDEVIAETGATDAKQMGAVIGGVMKRVGARAEGGAVSRLVREKLAG
ncbi:MAG: Glutamyl-tRNA(Gln) amidotransferase subunit [Patescibacteria group bacterium]|nr:Glutamyl-tRNA(Gln) amidotransferase subunit [Patescibacteria group bacterium]